MCTQRLTIRKFQRNDVENLYRLLSDEDVMRYIEKTFTMEETLLFLNQAGLSVTPLIFAVDDSDGKFVGYVIYHLYEKDSFEIGWVLHKHEWHKGYAQELTEMLINDAKTKTEYLILECAPEQTATKQIAKRNHFQYMGKKDGCDVYRLKINE